jgi:hypothetical protein
MSVQNEMKELDRMSTLMRNIGDRVGRSLLDVESMAPPPKESRVWLSTQMNPDGRRAVRHAAKSWRVSVASFIRFALHYTMEAHGYDPRDVLIEEDVRATFRRGRVPKPLTTAEEAGHRRRKPLVFARHVRSDDPSQPRHLHGEGDPEPGGDDAQ